MSLSVDALLRRAEEVAGLTDWGQDQAFRVGLEALVHSAVVDKVQPSALAGLERLIVDLLVTRLRFVEDEKQHPEILQQPIEKPLILTGLARTGTTILHDLCALDPAGRAPQDWETARPWPAPDAATYTTDPRIAQMQQEIEARLEAMPILRSMHPWGATLPSDCLNFLSLSFVCSRFVAGNWLPTYSHWLATEAPEGIYRTHRRALQQLQWRGPKGYWILKEPQHLLNLDQLHATYPDVRMVWTHRDPMRTLPSVASLIWTIQSIVRPDQDKKATGRQIFELFAAHLERGVKARKSAGLDGQILDIAYRDTVLDPVGTVRRIKEHFGMPFSDEHAARIERHMAENAQGKHGTHKYTAEEFGMDPEELRALMPEYRERFADYLEEPVR